MATHYYRGPDFLWAHHIETSGEITNIALPEASEEAKVLSSTATSNDSVVSTIIFRTNSWSNAMRIMKNVLLLSNKLLRKVNKNQISTTPETHLLMEVRMTFSTSRNCLKRGLPLKETDKLLRLAPYIDDRGLLRVGGRLRRSSMPFEFKHPIVLPSDHNIAKMVIAYHHAKVYHQGRVISTGSIRQAAYFIHRGCAVVARYEQ